MSNVDLIEQLENLGLVAQKSSDDELREHLRSGPKTVYCGFDPTADSLQAGNLVPLLALRRFQLAGHKPILLIGGATGMIGDPGGRTSERQLNPAETVQAFVEKIKPQASRFLDFDCGDKSAILVNNDDWTKSLTVIDYLRNIGKHFSVNAMIQKESVKRRLQDDSVGISYTEFSYTVLQSYDYAVLNEKYNCTVQIGGSDQWGNIVSGIDLVRRLHGNQVYALTFPLVTQADGTKFGKSEGHAVWLDPEKTSPFSFYQFWRNTDDRDVIRFLKTFTFLEAQELKEIEEAHELNPGNRQAHTKLAEEITQLVHGEEGLVAAERITEALFAGKLQSLTEADLRQLALDGLENTQVAAEEVKLLDMLVETGLALTPRGEVTLGQARKLLKSNAVSVNGVKVDDEDYILSNSAAFFNRYFILQKGKKNHHLVELRAKKSVA